MDRPRHRRHKRRGRRWRCPLSSSCTRHAPSSSAANGAIVFHSPHCECTLALAREGGVAANALTAVQAGRPKLRRESPPEAY
jgi:hypothetical protein